MKTNDDSILPLLPKKALEYFNDVSDSHKLYLKATSIRNCLENIVDTIFIHIVQDNNEITENQWNRKNLNDKLNYLRDYFPEDIFSQIHNIRKIGNKGTHPKGHIELNEDNIEITLKDLSKLSEWTILSYFKKYGFGIHTWIPKLFSTLQPIYRVRILSEYFKSLEFNKNDFYQYLENKNINPEYTILTILDNNMDTNLEFDNILLVIDKLSMAYLKNEEYEKSISFINQCHNDKIINDVIKNILIRKINNLNSQMAYLNISQSIQDTKIYIDDILKQISIEDEKLFVTIFIAIISQE